MALLFVDSCGDHLTAAQVTQKWSSGSVASIVTGFTGNAYHNPNSLLLGVTPASKLVTVGMRMNLNSLNTKLLTIYDTGNPECSWISNGDGSISAVNAAAVTVGTSAAGLLHTGTWNYLEFQALMATGATGTMEVKLNGTSVLLVNSVTTANGGGGATFFWSQIALTTTSSALAGDVDDLYLLDGSGVAPFTTYLGAVQINVLFPTANGDTVNWVPLVAPNFSQVNETTPDGDTSYNSSNTVGDLDLFTVGTANPSLLVLAAQRLINARQTVGGVTLAGTVKFGGTVTVGPAVAIGGSYAYGNRDVLQTAPDGSPWSNSSFNACQWGYKKTA